MNGTAYGVGHTLDCFTLKGNGKSMSVDIFTALLVEAHKQNRPESYRNDLLVHDYRKLSGDDATGSFGWVLRECGTELLDLRMSRDGLAGFIEHYILNGADNYYYIYTGGLLKRLPFSKWVTTMLKLNRPEPKALRYGY